MAGHAPEIGVKPLPNAKVAIISSSWHLDICNDLIAGAQRALSAAQVSKVEVQFVPGSFEIPLAAQYAFEAGFDAVVAEWNFNRTGYKLNFNFAYLCC